MNNNKTSLGAACAPPRRQISSTISALVLVLPLLGGCASSGFYNMTDDWCGRHLNASEVRCPGNQQLERRTAALPTAAAPIAVARTDRETPR